MIESWFFTHGLMLVSYLFAIFGISHMLRHKRSPGSTVAWLLLFIVAPLLGSFIYLMFGGRKLRLDKQAPSSPIAQTLDPSSETRDHWESLACSYGAFPPQTNNRVQLCSSGAEMLDQILELIERAKSSVCLSTYIFEDKNSGHRVLEALIKKAGSGVDVGLLIDGVGSVKTPRRFFHPLTEAGGAFAVFKPVIHLPFRAPTNLRNHRKILVIDGQTSFSGGINICDEEFHSQTKSPFWKDVGLLIHGPAAMDLQKLFERDWQFATKSKSATTSSESREHHEVAKTAVDGFIESDVQIMASGPDLPNDSIYSLSLTAIHRAVTRIWIVTPYFVPNDSLVESLTLACQRGIDVRILIPSRSNHLLSDLAAASLLRDIESNWFTGLESECVADKSRPSGLRQLGEGIIRMLSSMF